MRYMAPPLAELTAQAQTLSSAGDLAGAREVLDHVLRDANADPRRATADLAVAAALHARVLIALGDPQAARLWAGFAHAAEERLHGPATNAPSPRPPPTRQCSSSSASTAGPRWSTTTWSANSPGSTGRTHPGCSRPKPTWRSPNTRPVTAARPGPGSRGLAAAPGRVR